MNRNIFHPHNIKKHMQRAGTHIQHIRMKFAQLRRRKKELYTLLIVIAIIFIRRGVRGLLDVYLLPNSPLLSMIISIFIGLIILFLDNKKLEELSE